MKTKKRLAALFLAMMMVFSVMAMTASAYGEEGHVHDETCCDDARSVPEVPLCPYCNQPMYFYKNTYDKYGIMRPLYKCYDCGVTAWGGY